VPVADHARLAQVDADARKLAREEIEVRVAGAARQDLIPITRIAAVGFMGASGYRSGRVGRGEV
jgi:hypothetical protein